MVNSKKMRKSTVAIVLLSILLCLSMILTATGAWYTDSKSGSNTGADASFTMGEFATIEVLGNGEKASIKAFTKPQGGAEEEVTDGILFPGDTIKVTDGAKLSVKVTDGKDGDFYYVYTTDGGANWVGASDGVAKLHQKGDAAELASVNMGTATVTGTGAALAVKGADNVFTVNQKANKDVAGQTIVINVAGATLEVRIIQTANLTAAEAYAKLTANYENINA